MGSVLSQKEINELLLAVDASATGTAGSAKSDAKPVDIFSNDNFYVISIMHENFARKVMEYFSDRFKTVTKVEVSNIDIIQLVMYYISKR